MLSIFIQIIFIILLFFFLIFLGMQFFYVLFRGYAPFISTKKKVLDRVINEIKINDKAVVYELGCGKAGFLHLMRNKFPKAELIGVEFLLLPYLITKTQNSFLKSRIKIIKQNFFKTDLSKADVVYCYLSIKTMKALEGKFKNECRSGAEIISYQFPLPNTKEEKVIEVDGSKDKIYFYRI